MGKQYESTKRSPAAFGFGTSSRFSQGTPSEQPGPGKYDAENTWSRDKMGAISSSLNTSAGRAKIGTEPRFSRGKGDCRFQYSLILKMLSFFKSCSLRVNRTVVGQLLNGYSSHERKHYAS